MEYFGNYALPIRQPDVVVRKSIDLSKGEKEDYPEQLRSVLDEAIGVINKHIIQDRISVGLQINRLRMLRIWGLATLLICFALSPFATDLSSSHEWPSQTVADLIKLPPSLSILLPWINALAMMTLGAVGGYLSGLLQAQSTSVTFTGYLDNILKLQLRPLIGALISLILYTILSWQIIPGIKIENVGSYFITAFISGFSERYFLHLIRTDSEKQNSQIFDEVGPVGSIRHETKGQE